MEEWVIEIISAKPSGPMKGVISQAKSSILLTTVAGSVDGTNFYLQVLTMWVMRLMPHRWKFEVAMVAKVESTTLTIRYLA